MHVYKFGELQSSNSGDDGSFMYLRPLAMRPVLKLLRVILFLVVTILHRFRRITILTMLSQTS